jgi:hypothetical protein
MKEVNKNKNIMTEVAEFHSLPKRSMCKIEKQAVERADVQKRKQAFEFRRKYCSNDFAMLVLMTFLLKTLQSEKKHTALY